MPIRPCLFILSFDLTIRNKRDAFTIAMDSADQNEYVLTYNLRLLLVVPRWRRHRSLLHSLDPSLLHSLDPSNLHFQSCNHHNNWSHSGSSLQFRDQMHLISIRAIFYLFFLLLATFASNDRTIRDGRSKINRCIVARSNTSLSGARVQRSRRNVSSKNLSHDE